MELQSYMGLRVHVELTNKFYYTGLVISADEDSLTIRDKFNKLVSIKISSIFSIKEISQ